MQIGGVHSNSSNVHKRSSFKLLRHTSREFPSTPPMQIEGVSINSSDGKSEELLSTPLKPKKLPFVKQS